MARREALLRITKALVARRTELHKRLARQLDSLSRKATGDIADAAFEHSGEEVATQLAELEARELTQIETALKRIKQGKYGTCDGCDAKIPVARLDALPYSTLCIKCQREAENDSGWLRDKIEADWAAVRDDDGDRDVSIADIIDLSK